MPVTRKQSTRNTPAVSCAPHPADLFVGVRSRLLHFPSDAVLQCLHFLPVLRAVLGVSART